MAYSEIKNKIPKHVTLIAVSKTHPISSIRKLYDQGQRDFGENYAQELIEKQKQAAESGMTDIRWHFIGHLQSNKAKMIASGIHSLHTLDSLKLAKELQKHLTKKLPCFIEINIDQESSKSGVLLKDVSSLLSEVRSSCPLIEIQGLMCLPDPEKNPAHAFQEMRKAAQTHGLPFLSMGMSADFEEAIASGSTHVRIGTALFGKRE